jgi:hypothetical protein
MIQLKKEGGFFRSFSEKEINQTSSYFKIDEYPAGSVPSKPGESLGLIGVMVSGEAILEEKTEMKGKWIVLRSKTTSHQALITKGFSFSCYRQIFF